MDIIKLSEELDLAKIEVDEENYEIRIKVNKDHFWDWAKVFEHLAAVSNSFYSARRRAEASHSWKENHEKDIDRRDKEIKDKMRARYNEAFSELKNEREAMKVITKEFKEYPWLREAFREEINAKRDLEIIRLNGLKSREIAALLGIDAGTVRKLKGQNKWLIDGDTRDKE